MWALSQPTTCTRCWCSTDASLRGTTSPRCVAVPALPWEVVQRLAALQRLLLREGEKALLQHWIRVRSRSSHAQWMMPRPVPAMVAGILPLGPLLHRRLACAGKQSKSTLHLLRPALTQAVVPVGQCSMPRSAMFHAQWRIMCMAQDSGAHAGPAAAQIILIVLYHTLPGGFNPTAALYVMESIR